MTPERLHLIRVVHEKFCEWCEQQMECPVSDLLAEVDRLRAQVTELEADLKKWKPQPAVCQKCGARVSYSSLHLFGGANPGWRCPS